MSLISFASAATILGGSALLTTSYANQLESWLGEGNITITNIYTKQAGHTSANFHSAADGQGRTFSIIEVLGGVNQIIGGYNPRSWDSSSGYVTAYNTNAFVFNFNTGSVRYHTYTVQPYESYNYSSYGPTFGNGHDIYVNNSLTGGYTYSYAYRSNSRTGNLDIPEGYSYGLIASGSGLTIGRIEVFTISNVPVPEPTTTVLLGLGVLALGMLWKRK
ncbi:MAG: PEP-CTERM sorting domain-containing protein [Candidatus Brocadiae bacterium]|nr:PEP-CTERM sorting domain-containing protein [Candidatus Brocadiia bacterium]